MSKSPNQIAVEQLNCQLIPQINEQLVVQTEGFQAYQRLLIEADIHVSAEEQLRGYHQLCDSVPGLWVEGLLPQFYITPTEGGYDLNIAEPEEDEECDCCCLEPGFEFGACADEEDAAEPTSPLLADGVVPRFAVLSLGPDGQLRVHQVTPVQ